MILLRHGHQQRPLLQVERVRLGVVGRRPLDALSFFRRERGLQRTRDAHCDIALHVENVGHRALVLFAPHRLAARRGKQLHADADLRTRLAHAPGEHRANAQVARHIGQLRRGILEPRDRGATHDAQRRHLRELQRHLFGDARGKVRLFVAADAVERQHGDAARLGDGPPRVAAPRSSASTSTPAIPAIG